MILPPAGTVGGIAVRGGAPGTREAAILGPATPNEACHAVVLCGSSLFGLRAADGVVDWCEAQGIGLELAVGRFPIVGAAVVLDIHRRDMRRIDRDAGWAACEAATADEPANGSVGVGTGCTVGKEAGLAWASKGGQGSAVRQSGSVTVGALGGGQCPWERPWRGRPGHRRLPRTGRSSPLSPRPAFNTSRRG